MSFADLGLPPEVVDALARLGITEPTPVQRVAVPALLGGASVVAVARTGSGKTLAYAVPLLQRIHAVEQEEGPPTEPARPRALVLTSTRELVDQTARSLKSVAHRPRARVRAVAGGMDDRVQHGAIAGPLDVLVANPPRLVALVRAGRVRLDDVRVVVVDEADTLLAPGQRAEVEEVLARIPAGRQVAWISATLPEPIRAWLLARPERPALLYAKDAHTAPERVAVTNVRVKPSERADAAHDVLVALPASARGIVFTNRRETADRAGALLAERGHDVRVVHGGRPPEERRAAMNAFRRGDGRVLVTTELAGRGLHVEGLAFVVNWELPERASDYVHRIGRVGREGGGAGRVYNLVTPADAAILGEIERLARGGRLDTGEPLRAARTRKPREAPARPRRGEGRVGPAPGAPGRGRGKK